MNDLVRLPPPGDQAGYEQWRRDFVAFEERAVADRARREAQNLLWLMFAGVFVVAMQLPQFAEALRLPIPSVTALQQLGLVLQLATIVAIGFAALLHWQTQRARVRDSMRMIELYRMSMALESEFERG